MVMHERVSGNQRNGVQPKWARRLATLPSGKPEGLSISDTNLCHRQKLDFCSLSYSVVNSYKKVVYNKYARQDSNLQPSVPKTDALSSCATDARVVPSKRELYRFRIRDQAETELRQNIFCKDPLRVLKSFDHRSHCTMPITSVTELPVKCWQAWKQFARKGERCFRSKTLIANGVMYGQTRH